MVTDRFPCHILAKRQFVHTLSEAYEPDVVLCLPYQVYLLASRQRAVLPILLAL